MKSANKSGEFVRDARSCRDVASTREKCRQFLRHHLTCPRYRRSSQALTQLSKRECLFALQVHLHISRASKKSMSLGEQRDLFHEFPAVFRSFHVRGHIKRTLKLFDKKLGSGRHFLPIDHDTFNLTTVKSNIQVSFTRNRSSPPCTRIFTASFNYNHG